MMAGIAVKFMTVILAKPTTVIRNIQEFAQLEIKNNFCLLILISGGAGKLDNKLIDGRGIAGQGAQGDSGRVGTGSEELREGMGAVDNGTAFVNCEIEYSGKVFGFGGFKPFK